MTLIDVLQACFWGVLAGFVIHFGLKGGLIGSTDFTIGVIAGCIGGVVVSILPTVIMPAVYRKKKARH
jgi:hypothetical protein